jgi:hypothetical protein
MANSPTDVLHTLEVERAKYGTPMTEDACVNMLNSVAWAHRNADGSPCWVQNFKNWSEGWGTRYDNTTLSIDTLIHLPSRHIYDVLLSAPTASTPAMMDLGIHTQSARYPVAPIESRGPLEPPQTLVTELGATYFCLLDLFLHDQARGERQMAHLRDEMGVRFLRPFWRKGNGSPGDYWLNEGGSFPLVQSRPDPLAMQEAMLWAYENGFTLAHCLFADSLTGPGTYLTVSEQLTRVDDFLRAVGDIQPVSRYYEIFNEPYTRGGGHGGKISDLHACARHLRAALGPGPLIALGTPQSVHAENQPLEAEIIDMYARCPEANLITAHFPRGSGNNNPQTCPDLTVYAPIERSCGEPIGPDSSVDETKDPAALATNFRYCRQQAFRFYVYHDHRNIRVRAEEFFHRPEWPAIADALRVESGATPAAIRFPAATAYSLGGSVTEFGALRGIQAQYARIDPNEPDQGMWPGSYPVWFDRDTVGEYEKFELSPLEGGKFKIRHLATGHILGADATKSSGDVYTQFYTMPENQLGAYETFTVVELPNQKVIAFIDYGAFISAALTWETL